MKAMKAAVVILFATSLASVYAQGRQAAPPEPPAKETVAPGIPGVVAAGTERAARLHRRDQHDRDEALRSGGGTLRLRPIPQQIS